MNQDVGIEDRTTKTRCTMTTTTTTTGNSKNTNKKRRKLIIREYDDDEIVPRHREYTFESLVVGDDAEEDGSLLPPRQTTGMSWKNVLPSSSTSTSLSSSATTPTLDLIKSIRTVLSNMQYRVKRAM